MKRFLSVCLISASTFCFASAKDAKPASNTTATADACSISIEGTDMMQYQRDGKKLESITVPATCKKTFTVKFRHSGQLKNNVMGHNFVLTKTADAQSINTEAMKLGPTKNYMPDLNVEPFKSKVLAISTKMLGGGDSEEIVVALPRFQKGTAYTFFCTFPGHFAMMQGKFIIE